MRIRESEIMNANGCMIGVYRISIPPEADSEELEELIRTEVFPRVELTQTRGGIVTGQYFSQLSVDSDCEPPASGKVFSWIVLWRNQGGSPFGSESVPLDPAARLERLGAKTLFTLHECILSQEVLPLEAERSAR